MEHPDMSIFQGSEGLHLDPSLQHLEEDEAEEEQKLRKKELQDMLSNAFDDLMDDDDISTVNSTCHSSAVLEEYTARPLTSTDQHPPQNYLKKSVGRQYSDLKPTGDNSDVSEHYQYCCRNSPYEESNEQYRKAVSSRERVSQLEQELETLKQNLLNVQQSNLKLSGELDAAHISVRDLEEKVSLLERSNVANSDTLLRRVQERHEKEMISLRNQIESITAKLNSKDAECDGLRQRLTDLNRTHEALLVEKTDTINQLMVNLEESQRQCQKLMLNVDNGQTFAEKEQLEKCVQQLKREVDTLKSDLKLYEAVSQFGMLGPEDSDTFRMVSKPQPSTDLNIKLQDDLQRCLASVHMKRNEIKQLQAQLVDRDKVIQAMKQQEAVYIAQTDNFKAEARDLLEQLRKCQAAQGGLEDVSKLQSHITELQSELTAVKADRYRLEGELVILRQTNVEEKLRAIDQHSQEYIQWHDKAVARVRQEAHEQIQALTADFNIRLREAQKESDEVKQLYVEVCSSKEKLLATLECEQKAKKDLATCLDMETEKLRKAQADLETERQKLTQLLTSSHSADVEELRRSLGTEKEKVQALETDLQAAREQDSRYVATVTEEIERAKMVALQELQFNPLKPRPDVVDKACSPLRDKAGDEEIARVVATLEAKHKEQLEQLKQESIRCLADELSVCEARHQQHLEQALEKYLHNLAVFQNLIDSKTQEVEVLKQAMMMKPDKLRGDCENSQVTAELTVCTKEVGQLKEQLQCCDKEWQARLRAETNMWEARLEEHQQDVETEQAKMAEVVAGWAGELQTVRKQYEEAEMRLTELQNKYRAAKKTARRYKLWADGKERHINREWQRIVVGFQKVLQVVQAKAQEALTDTDGDNPVTKQLDEQIQALQDTLLQYTPR